MAESKEARNKALVLKAFDTLFNKRDYEAAERYWSPNYIQHSGPKGYIDYDYPEFSRSNEVRDANRIQSNCSQ